MENKSLHKLGIDIGSTTVKVAVLDEQDNLLFSDYERHFADIQETLTSLIQKAFDQLGELSVAPMITGSGGLTLAKHLEVPFVQEVISVSTALQHYAPQTDVAIELGGEDAKIIYFEGGNVEQRMNGICAGGTGSFIDQMASLIQTDASGLNEYAKNYKAIYPIAARCGVFAKTDIQPLINEGATREDLSASIFQAVVNQTISGLACGKPIRGHVAFLGGPLHFLSELKAAFIRTLNLDDEHAITPDNSHLFAAIGSALNYKEDSVTTLSTLLKKLSSGMMAKLKIAVTMARKAKVYLLDEPLNGIDLLARDQIMTSILEAMDKDVTLVVSSHLVDELERVADAALFMKDGHLVEQCMIEDLRMNQNKSVVDLYREIYGHGGEGQC